METPCIVYAIATIFLSFVEAIRFKIKWGKVDNIKHSVSVILGAAAAGAVLGWWIVDCGFLFHWLPILAIVMVGVSFIGIRLALYDPMLNLFRLWTGTNSTGRIDYVSTVTSSYEDQHSEKVPFWCKRIGGALGWLLMFLLYKVIFKV